MGTLTSRLKLFKAALLDPVDVVADIQGPFDGFDAEIGLPNIGSGSPLPGTPYDGQIRYDKNDNFVKQYDAATTAWKVLFPGPSAAVQGAGGSWKTFAPTLTNVTLGTGTPKNFMDYIRLPGNIIAWRYVLVLGTAGALSASGMTVSLPVEFPVDITVGTNPYIPLDTIGQGVANCSVRRVIGAQITSTAAPGTMLFTVADSGLNVATGNPGTWAAGNTLTASGFYRTSAT